MAPTDSEPSPLVCNVAALSEEERAERSRLAARVRQSSTAVSEYASGYAIRLGSDPRAWRDALELCLLERRCCPFLTLELSMEAGAGPVWLRVGGPPGVKEFLISNGVLGCADMESDHCP